LNQRIKLRVKLILRLFFLSFEYFRKISNRCHVFHSPRALNPNHLEKRIPKVMAKCSLLIKYSLRGGNWHKLSSKLKKPLFSGQLTLKNGQSSNGPKNPPKNSLCPINPIARRFTFHTINHYLSAGYLTPQSVRVFSCAFRSNAAARKNKTSLRAYPAFALPPSCVVENLRSCHRSPRVLCEQLVAERI
jgi:hypothetical protein